MRVLLSLVPSVVAIACALQGCKKAPPPGPPPPKAVSISVSPGAAPVKELTGQVVVLPYKEGRERLFEAMLKRRKMEETLRNEQAELEKLLPNDLNAVAVAPANVDKDVDRMIAAAKRTIDSLADLGLIYYEEVASQKAGELPPERLAAFREKLGVDELKRASNAMKAEDPAGSQKAVESVLEVLKREVYTAPRVSLERARAETVVNQLAAELEKVSASTPADVAVAPKKPTGAEALMRYMNNRATHRQTTDPLAMFTALNAKAVTQTDSDGKCTVEIPQHGRWIVGICFQRPGTDPLSQNFGLSQSFCWIEEIPADRNQLSFTADNMLRPSIAPLGLEQSVPWR